MPLIPLSHGTYTPDSTWSGQRYAFDTSQANADINLPAAASLGADWHIPWIGKADPTSGKVRLRVTAEGDYLNAHWDKDHPYGLVMNRTQQVAELVCDGVSNFYLAEKTWNRGGPQSQRTITMATYNVTPDDVNELIVCDTTQSPASDHLIYLHLSPLSAFLPRRTWGSVPIHYPSQQIWVQKNDAGPGMVVIGPDGPGEIIRPNNDNLINPTLVPLRDRFLYLTKQWDTCCIDIKSDGFFLTSFTRASMLPQSSTS